LSPQVPVGFNIITPVVLFVLDMYMLVTSTPFVS